MEKIKLQKGHHRRPKSINVTLDTIVSDLHSRKRKFNKESEDSAKRIKAMDDNGTSNDGHIGQPGAGTSSHPTAEQCNVLDRMGPVVELVIDQMTAIESSVDQAMKDMPQLISESVYEKMSKIVKNIADEIIEKKLGDIKSKNDKRSNAIEKQLRYLKEQKVKDLLCPRTCKPS